MLFGWKRKEKMRLGYTGALYRYQQKKQRIKTRLTLNKDVNIMFLVMEDVPMPKRSSASMGSSLAENWRIVLCPLD